MRCLSSTFRIMTFCKNRRIFLSKSLLRYLSVSAPWGTTAEQKVPSSKILRQDISTSKSPTKPLPEHADVVIMGGGSLGCHTLYHLAKMGISNVVLLERDWLTSGTTWHTAGLLWQLRPSDTEIELLKHTRDVVSKDLEEETGLHTGWIENGGLFIASNKQRLDEYKRLMSSFYHKHLGQVELEAKSAPEVRTLP
ncbi:sarcosine dehydrogenase, mitochondrial-like [Chiloscyllium plagiosum]|uniref:sarcosine dehydrogenase, mitochondrial-like n=1 Tax=Chiloscyllium plagiosum TaxID=36176 RepID=UPI001CB870D2|nr:sarcosine dehydrogenase, mitochondrial-like [Chiloscyllium plagiosum]